MKNTHKSIILTVILTGILCVEVFICLQKYNILPVFSINAVTEAQIKDELITALFMSHIVSDSSAFYDNYFSTQLEYFNYVMKIEKVKKKFDKSTNTTNLYITFGITPMIGAHNPVGYDEAVYRVDVFGNITLEEFTHKKSFDIPEWLKTDMIKPYP